MPTVPVRRATSQWLLLNNIDWPTYTRLLRIFAERPAARLAYDRGTLEIIGPLYEHDFDADLLGRLVVTLTEELALPIASGGSTALRRRGKQRGLEPDRCYWITNEPRVRGKRRLDLRVDPPPDLALEVDVTHSSLNRMRIYAALRVPEVWRLESLKLMFHVLGGDGNYSESSYSRAFPLVTPADLTRFLALRATHDANSIVRQFRAWVRQLIATNGSAPPPS
jgi:Uma2 family endonuclease